MTPLHRSVPQRRRRNVLDNPAAFLVAVMFVGVMLWVMTARLIGQVVDQPSRLQPALDQIQRFGERKCREVGR